LEPFWALVGNLEKAYVFAIFSFCQIGFWGGKGGLFEAHRKFTGTFGWAPRNAQVGGEGLGGVRSMPETLNCIIQNASQWGGGSLRAFRRARCKSEYGLRWSLVAKFNEGDI
jgi:hypothetical protein